MLADVDSGERRSVENSWFLDEENLEESFCSESFKDNIVTTR